MTNPGKNLAKLSSIKLALVATEARSRAELIHVEPLAIVGAGCRFPGYADNPELYWQLLRDETDAITDVPADRWDAEAFYDPKPQVRGKISSRSGGFVDHLREFDADFFGISPREAISLDPQQRMLLEVTWEAMENAGIPPDALAGTSTGVFVGVSGIDYVLHIQASQHEIDAYIGTGNALSVASGRVSYLFGLQGPSVSIDTACSSSLVAIHLACQSLRNRECDVALAGGTHRILLPHASIGLSQSRALAPDGRCKAFDATADGYVRGEGCGVVLLKRLSDAIADGDNIMALIRGSAVNQDGKTSGLTVPNGPAQQDVIRRAMTNAAVDAAQVGYVEAHGTGTPLGDPIEVTSLAAVFSPGRPRTQPLLIGSVKTNVGHLEASAGVAGLLKVALALQHGEIPAQLHLRKPSSYIPWDRLPIQVATSRTPWPVIDGRRIGGVSSFGFSGTNAHVILEETPRELLAEADAPAQEQPGPYLLTLSANSSQALRDLAGRYLDYLSTQEQHSYESICYTSSAGRNHLPHRLASLAGDHREARRYLTEWLSGSVCSGVWEGRCTKLPKIAFFFSGDLAYFGAEEFYAAYSSYRAVIDEADDIGRQHGLSPSLRAMARGGGRGLEPLTIGRPAQFTFACALASIWQSFGIEACAMAGEGAGEFAAACVAGVFTFREGLESLLRLHKEVHEAGSSDRDSTGMRAEAMALSKPRCALLSAVTGRRLAGEVHEAAYWARSLGDNRLDGPSGDQERMPCNVVLSIGTSNDMIPRLRERLPFDSGVVLATVSRAAESPWSTVRGTAAALYTAGAKLLWDKLYEGCPKRRVVLPSYPFQRQRYWVDAAAQAPVGRVIESEPGNGPRNVIQRGALTAVFGEERRVQVERYVRSQLAEILKRSEDLIDQHEPLQALGIDSLMATELKYRIEGDLRITIDFQGANADFSVGNVVDVVISALDLSADEEHTPRINLIRNTDSEAVASLLVAHEKARRVPLFFIHPGGIDISSYLNLAQNLSTEQPLYVLHPHGLYDNYSGDTDAGPEISIAQAASLCVSEIRKLLPSGPFLLAGWSLGALVAYDTARQLRASGDRVPLLMLLDVMCGPSRDGSTLPLWFADLLEARTGRALQYSFEQLHKRPPNEQLECLWRKAVDAQAVPAAMPLSEFQSLFDRFTRALATSWVRAKEYRLDRELCADRVAFLNSAELSKPERCAQETVFDWTGGLRDGVEIQVVPGNHYTMLFPPAVEELGRAMQQCVDRATALTHVQAVP